MNYKLKRLLLAAHCLFCAGLWVAHSAPFSDEMPLSVDNPCVIGEPFTITVPVYFPANMQVQYQWYRNGQPVTGVNTLSSGSTAISYTIPAAEAEGDSVLFHFMYCLNDECGATAWTPSRQYVVWFTDCRIMVVGSIGGDNCGRLLAGAIWGTTFVEGTPGCATLTAGSIRAPDQLGCYNCPSDFSTVCQMVGAGSVSFTPIHTGTGTPPGTGCTTGHSGSVRPAPTSINHGCYNCEAFTLSSNLCGLTTAGRIGAF